MKNRFSFSVCAVAVGIVLGTLTAPVHAAPGAGHRVMPLQGLPANPKSTGTTQLIVKYKPGSVPGRDRSQVQGRLSAAAVGVAGTSSTRGALRLRSIRRSATGADLITTSRPLRGAEAETLLKQLRQDPDVAYAQVDGRKFAAEVMPNDPKLPIYQWDLLNTVGGIHGPEAWGHSTGEGVVVAVLDTGYRPHADLVGNVLPGYDFVSWYGQSEDEPDIAGDGDGRDPDASDPGDWTDDSMAVWCGNTGDSSWHGTHVAGTVAAMTNNGRDVAGTAWGAKVQPVRVLGHCGGLTSDIADAIVWAAGGTVDGIPVNPTPADVINMSLGGAGACSEDPATQDAIDFAVARGTTVVVAAGNQAADVSGYSPASCRNVISVGATGVDGRMASYSNFGSSVALAAPGGDTDYNDQIVQGAVWSTSNDGTTVPGNDAVVGLMGTSMASPHVAGIVALMQSAAVGAGRPALTPLQVRQMLVDSVRPFPVVPPVARPIGAGLADAGRAVQLALGNPLPLPRLTNAVSSIPLAGDVGDSAVYQFEVPAGTRSINLRSLGGRGDVSLYASAGIEPTADDAQYRSRRPGNAEVIIVNAPAPGTWYLRVVGEAAFSGVTLNAVAR